MAIQVKTGQEFLKTKSTPFPDAVCWILSDEAQSKQIQQEIRGILDLGTPKQPAPALVIYAPQISPRLRAEFVALGAIVYDKLPGDWFDPRNEEELKIAITRSLEQNSPRTPDIKPDRLRFEPEEKLTSKHYQDVLDYLYANDF